MDKPVYEMLWRNKFLTTEALTLDDMIMLLEHAVYELKKMRDAGVILEGGAEDDYARLVTSDPEVAKQFGMEDLSEEEDE
jgi:hypothetical protein